MFELVSPPAVWFQNKILCVLRISIIRATRPANIILSDLFRLSTLSMIRTLMIVPRLETAEIALPLIFQFLFWAVVVAVMRPPSHESSIL
jgi:hypothetical protein